MAEVLKLAEGRRLSRACTASSRARPASVTADINVGLFLRARFRASCKVMLFTPIEAVGSGWMGGGSLGSGAEGASWARLNKGKAISRIRKIVRESRISIVGSSCGKTVLMLPQEGLKPN